MENNIIEVLASSLQVGADELATLKDGDNWKIDEVGSYFTKQFDTVKNERYNAGISEGKKQWEGKITKDVHGSVRSKLAEKLGVEANKDYDVMIDTYLQEVKKTSQTKEIKDNDILNHQAHLSVVENLKTELDALRKKNASYELATKTNQIETGFAEFAKKNKLSDGYKIHKESLLKRAFSEFVAGHGKDYKIVSTVPGVYQITDMNDSPIRSPISSDEIDISQYFRSNFLDPYFDADKAKPETPGGQTQKSGPSQVVNLNFSSSAEALKAYDLETDLKKKRAIMDKAKELRSQGK